MSPPEFELRSLVLDFPLRTTQFKQPAQRNKHFSYCRYDSMQNKGNKVFPVQAYVEVKVEPHSFSILAIDWMDNWFFSRHALFTSGGWGLPVPMAQEGGCMPEPLWALWMRGQTLGRAGNRITIPSLSSP